MSNFKNLMSQLRISKEENVAKTTATTKTKVKEKYLKLKKGNKYIVRLLPYLTEDGRPKTVKDSWYHFKDGTKYGCSYPSCPLCGNTKKTLQKLVNVQLKKTTDDSVFENDYYILSLHKSLYDMIDKFEKDNSLSMFDIFGAGELTIEVDSKPSGYGNDILTYNESTISSILLPLSNDIETYTDEQIMAFIKEFTFDLDKETASLPKYQENKNVVVETKKETIVDEDVVKPIKKPLGQTLKDIKNSIDMAEDVSINVSQPKEEEKKQEVIVDSEYETTKPVKTTKTTKKEEINDSNKSNESDDYIKSFLDELDD